MRKRYTSSAAAFGIGCVLLGVAIAIFFPGTRYLPVPQGSWVALVGAGVGEIYVGYRVRGWIRERRIGVGPGLVSPLVVARVLAISTALLYAGICASGLWGTLVVDAFIHRSQLKIAAHNLWGDAFSFVGSLLLIAGALWLRSSCRPPRSKQKSHTRDQEL